METNDFKESLKYPKEYAMPEQQNMAEKLMQLLDEYQLSNSFENREFLCYLTSAIYLSYKKLFPQLNIYIPFRIKGDSSFMKNIPKEFTKWIEKVDSDEPFDLFPIEKDISALKVVIDNINFSLPFTPESEELFNDPEIKELLGDEENNTKDKNNDEKEETLDFSRRKNVAFINKVNNFLQSPIKTGKQYFELKKELLQRIIAITPDEFVDERKPNPSYCQLLEKLEEDYAYLLENDDVPTNISDSQITELRDLLNELRPKIDDKLHFAILRKTLPIILEQPWIKNVLQTSFEFNKEPKKPNAFQAIYYTINTPFGPVELQGQSNRAYYNSTKGSAYHSGLDGKTVNVKDFFELVDPNDEHDLSYYLDILDSFSADKLVSPYELPEFKTEEEREEFLKTPKGAAYIQSETYREMMKHIKIKEKIEIIPQNLPKEVYISDKEIDYQKLQELIDSGQTLQKPYVMDANLYLFSTALSLSPYMNVCSSSHTSYTNAGIHHKKVIGEFAEILRKKDSNTCLREMLIRRLEELIDSPQKFAYDMKTLDHIIQLTYIVNNHDTMATKLPKNISPKNIMTYGERLRERLREKLRKRSNSDLDRAG